MVQKQVTKGSKRLPKLKARPNNGKINFAAWEVKKSYDDVIKAIGRNRKLILSMFVAHEKTGEKVTIQTARQIIGKVLRKQKITVKKEYWPLLLNFAVKKGKLNYVFLLNIYRDRAARMDLPS